MVRTRPVEPDQAQRSAFDERYRKWRELYASLHSWTI
jgi:sugar (pentulose or hexulose) kinase